MLLVDGGSDQNPRYPKTIAVAADTFKKQNLDVLLIHTLAPGLSAYNNVERRMAPLSKELSGVVLPFESYGSHLDSSGKTINKTLEKKNFKKSGELLSKIFSNMVIDKEPVVAEYLEDKKLVSFQLKFIIISFNDLRRERFFNLKKHSIRFGKNLILSI